MKEGNNMKTYDNGDYAFIIVKDEEIIYRHYKYDVAKEYFERVGGKLYAHTKELFPKRFLIAWS